MTKVVTGLTGSECTGCGSRFYPRLTMCPSCHTREMKTYQLPSEGVLYSYAIVRIGPKGVPVPYAVGYVDLSDGVRLFARLEGWTEGSLRCDLPVTLSARVGEGGQSLTVARVS